VHLNSRQLSQKRSNFTKTCHDASIQIEEADEHVASRAQERLSQMTSITSSSDMSRTMELREIFARAKMPMSRIEDESDADATQEIVVRERDYTLNRIVRGYKGEVHDATVWNAVSQYHHDSEAWKTQRLEEALCTMQMNIHQAEPLHSCSEACLPCSPDFLT